MRQPSGDTSEDPLSIPFSGAGSPEAHLFVVLECDRPLSGGARYALAGIDEVVIGRAEERTRSQTTSGGVERLHLGVPGRSMSGLHARVLRNAQGFVLEDAGSTNGTFVNGARTTRSVLADGDIIELGHTIFLFRSALATPEETPRTYDWNLEPPAHQELATLRPDLCKDFATLARVARANVSTVLLGETGTGKERMARAMHRISNRPGAFVPVNCGALSPNLVESQLFGHVKGAFSGADRDELGFVRTADHGTLLLDEVAELPASAQVALLRVLQDQEVVPVGCARGIPVDVRILAATHRPLEALVRRQSFRADLFARLDGFRYQLASLRSRREDLGLMVAELLRAAGSEVRLKTEVGVLLVSHAWPYNVRELVQRLKRAVALTESGLLTESDLAFAPVPPGTPLPAGNRQSSAASQGRVSDLVLKQELVRTLEQCSGNVSEAARVMGKARMQIQRWMKRLGIDPTQFRPPDDR